MIDRLTRGEAVAVELVANLAPWLAPLPTAWLVADRTMVHLGWPLWVAMVAGVTLELLGVGILATWLMLFGYNRERRKTDPRAAEWPALLLVGLYFFTAEALTVVLDVWPLAAVWAPALFPVLSVASFGLLALRADHRRRLDAIAAQKVDARAERERKRAEKAQAQIAAAEAAAQATEPPPFRTAMEKVRWLHETQPELSRTQLAANIGCAPSTVTRALAGRDGDGEGVYFG